MNAPAQLSPEWFAARVGKISGSRVGAILGVNPYSKPKDVLRAMVREALGADNEFKGNFDTDRGNRLESTIVGLFEVETGLVVRDSPPLQIHPNYKWLAASPDGFVGDDELIEIKAPRKIKTLEEVPHYIAQIQLQLECTGRKLCYFVQYQEDIDLLDIQEVRHDPNWLKDNFEKLDMFLHEYHDIISDPSRHTEFLEDETLIIEDPEFLGAAEELADISAKIKELTQLEKAYKSKLISLSNGRKCKGGSVTVYPTSRTTVDYKTALADAGVTDLVKYQKQSTSWTVRVSA